MISKECFTTTWIDQKSKELQYNDKNIIEKVIRAFSLLDMLAQSGCPLHFKRWLMPDAAPEEWPSQIVNRH